MSLCNVTVYQHVRLPCNSFPAARGNGWIHRAPCREAERSQQERGTILRATPSDRLDPKTRSEGHRADVRLPPQHTGRKGVRHVQPGKPSPPPRKASSAVPRPHPTPAAVEQRRIRRKRQTSLGRNDRRTRSPCRAPGTPADPSPASTRSCVPARDTTPRNGIGERSRHAGNAFRRHPISQRYPAGWVPHGSPRPAQIPTHNPAHRPRASRRVGHTRGGRGRKPDPSRGTKAS